MTLCRQSFKISRNHIVALIQGTLKWERGGLISLKAQIGVILVTMTKEDVSTC